MYIVTLENLIYILPALYTDPLRSNISHFYATYHLYVCTVYSPCKFSYRGQSIYQRQWMQIVASLLLGFQAGLAMRNLPDSCRKIMQQTSCL